MLNWLSHSGAPGILNFYYISRCKIFFFFASPGLLNLRFLFFNFFFNSGKFSLQFFELFLLSILLFSLSGTFVTYMLLLTFIITSLFSYIFYFFGFFSSFWENWSIWSFKLLICPLVISILLLMPSRGFFISNIIFLYLLFIFWWNLKSCMLFFFWRATDLWPSCWFGPWAGLLWGFQHFFKECTRTQPECQLQWAQEEGMNEPWVAEHLTLKNNS